MANFSPGWNFSLVNRVETSARLLQQILLKSNCRLHGEVFSLGRNSARAENPSPLCSCSRCHFDSPETLRAQFHIFGAEANISARAEVRHVIATKLQPGQPGWNFSPGWNSPCNQAQIDCVRSLRTYCARTAWNVNVNALVAEKVTEARSFCARLSQSPFLWEFSGAENGLFAPAAHQILPTRF